VRWRFEDAPRSATACNCSLCRRNGALWAYGFEGEDFGVPLVHHDTVTMKDLPRDGKCVADVWF
jgi:hypothetical protein